MYDVTCLPTFLSVEKWIKDIRDARGPEGLIILVGNKTDEDEKRKVTLKDAEAKAEELEVKFVETSARTGENISKIFRIAATELNVDLEGITSKIGQTIHITPQN